MQKEQANLVTLDGQGENAVIIFCSPPVVAAYIIWVRFNDDGEKGCRFNSGLVQCNSVFILVSLVGVYYDCKRIESVIGCVQRRP